MKKEFLLLCMFIACFLPSTAQKLDSFKYFIIEEQISNNDRTEIWEISNSVTKDLVENGLMPIKYSEMEKMTESEKQMVLHINILYSQIAYGAYNTVILFKDSSGKLITVHQGKYRGYRADGYLSSTEMALNDIDRYAFSRVYARQGIKRFSIQPKVGLNIANVTGKVPTGFDKGPRWGLACGVEIEYICSRKTGLSLGILYSMQGAKVSGKIDGVNTTEIDKVDYINFPVMVNCYVSKGLALKFGVQPAIRINEGYKLSAQGTSLTGKLSDLGYKFNSFDFSVPVGLSYEFSNIVIDARYNIGITNIAKDDDDSSRNHVFQLTIGYKFKL